MAITFNAKTTTPIQSGYADSSEAQDIKDAHYNKFAGITSKKEEAYRNAKLAKAKAGVTKEYLFTKLKSSPKDSSLLENYNNTNRNYSSLETDENVAWWSWHDAVGAQRHAIIV